MALPKRGARRIVVDGVPYRWRVSKDLVPDQTPLRTAIELVNQPGTSLVVMANDRPHPQDVRTFQDTRNVVPITALDVSRWIAAALRLGWMPASKGSPFLLRAREDGDFEVIKS